MKLIYKGKYNGDVNMLPHGEHKPGAVKFKEFDDAKTLGIVANIIALVITVGLFFLFLGTLGALCLGMGAGDYYNVFNALTQMPRGARTYLYQFNSYWYMP